MKLTPKGLKKYDPTDDGMEMVQQYILDDSSYNMDKIDELVTQTERKITTHRQELDAKNAQQDIRINSKADANHTHDGMGGGGTPSEHNHDDRYYTESEVNSRLSTKSNTDHTHSNYYTVGDLDNAVVGLSISGNKLIATRKNGTTIELQLPSGGGGVQEKFQISVDEAVATVVNNQFTFKKDGTLVVRYLEACDITLTISSAGTGYYMLTTLLSGVSSTVTWNRDLKSYTYTGKVNDTISLRADSANWIGKIE